jgi:hypothetical protein
MVSRFNDNVLNYSEQEWYYNQMTNWNGWEKLPIIFKGSSLEYASKSNPTQNSLPPTITSPRHLLIARKELHC